MYTIVKTLAASKSLGSKFIQTNLSSTLIATIFSTYRKVYLELSNPLLPSNIYVDLDTLKGQYQQFTGTLSEAITDYGDRTMQTVPSLPVSNPRYAFYSDAFRAGYSLLPTNISVHPSNTVTDDLKTDVMISRANPVTDMNLFFNSCLVSINGYFHKTDFAFNNVYVVGAMKTVNKGGKNKMGFIRFNDIGAIQQIAITPQMISPDVASDKMIDTTYISLPVDVSNKTVMASIGGYLYFLGNELFISGDDVISLKFNKTLLLQRYMESFRDLDFESLGLPKSPTNDSIINIEEFFSNEVLTKYLGLQQSFIIVVDTPSIFTNVLPIKNSSMPGRFTTVSEPKYPLFVSTGKIAEYWKVRESNRWEVFVTDNYYRNFILDSINLTDNTVAADTMIAANRYRISHGNMLEIGTDFPKS